jgi:hypothetical protein
METRKKQGLATFMTALSVRVIEGRAMKRFHVALGVADVKLLCRARGE